MCEPTTLAIVSIAATVIGTGVSAYGMMQQAHASSAASDYNAQIAANNQKLADAQATDAEAQGRVLQQQKADAQNQLLGRQKAALASNGVDVNSGSAVDLESDTKANGVLDQLTIANNAARTSAGFKNQSISYQDQANLDKLNSQNTAQAGALAAGSSLLSGAGKVASQWYDMKYGTRQTNPTFS